MTRFSARRARRAVFPLRILSVSALLCALVLPAGVQATPFCDCCCNAAAGTGPICAGCDLNGSASVTFDEVSLLGCATNPICVALFPPATATATRPPAACAGDCNGNGEVTINELLTMVNVALENAPVTACSVGDTNGDSKITVAELVAAVSRALAGCSGVTPSSTVTATPTGSALATATATDGETIPVPTATAAPPTEPASPSATATGTRLASPTATRTATRTTLATVTATRTANATASATVTRSLSATPTRTASPTASATASLSRTATPTQTTGVTPSVCAAVAESAAGGAVIIANGMGVIPEVVASIVSGVRFGQSSLAAIAGQGTGGMCPRGGTATRTGSIPGTMMISLDACTLATSDGLLVVDGTVNLNGLLTLTLNANLQFVNKDQTGVTTRLTSSATLMGSVTPQLGGTCFLTGGNLQLTTGALTSQVPGEAEVSVGFTNTAVAMSVASFTSDCVPANYSLTFNGPATLGLSSAPALAELDDRSIPVTFNAFTVTQNATVMPAQTGMNGTVSAACFGGAIMVTTRSPLTQAVGVLCPTGGALRVAAGVTVDVLYLSGDAVGIDTNLDGLLDGPSDETISSCVDARLTACQTQCAPPSTATRTSNATATATTGATGAATPTATRTSNPTPTTPSGVSSATATRTASLSPTPTVTTAPVTETRFCDTLSLPAAIPDDNTNGINNSITVPNGVAISDLNVEVAVSHTYVGDLRLRLTHVDTGTTVRLIERPGIDISCGENDVTATFDDEAGRAAQLECPDSPPAIDGSVKPADALAGFDGQQIGGTWRLNVADLVEQDTGSLVGWCLVVNSPAPVVTELTCNGDTTCTVNVGEIFGLQFSWFDPTGNASSWRISAVRDDDFAFEVGTGTIDPANGFGTIPVNILPFFCDAESCRQTEYDYRVTITDTTGLESPALRVHIVVPAT